MLISARLRELEIDLSSIAQTDRQERERERAERNGMEWDGRTEEKGGGKEGYEVK